MMPERFEQWLAELTKFNTCQRALTRLHHKGKWLEYLAALLDALPVRKAAGRLGVYRNTTFRWRHRFPQWVKLDRPARKRGGQAKRRGISRELDCILWRTIAIGVPSMPPPGVGPCGFSLPSRLRSCGSRWRSTMGHDRCLPTSTPPFGFGISTLRIAIGM